MRRSSHFLCSDGELPSVTPSAAPLHRPSAGSRQTLDPSSLIFTAEVVSSELSLPDRFLRLLGLNKRGTEVKRRLRRAR